MNWLVNWIIRRAQRTPFFHLEGYMNRWWLVQERWWLPFSIRVHEILRSDNDRHLHDHPWWSISIILRGAYIEILPKDRDQDPVHDRTRYKTRLCWPGTIAFRTARTRHRLIIPFGVGPCWSLFIMGKNTQEWGFYVPSMHASTPEDCKVHWRNYLGDYTSPER